MVFRVEIKPPEIPKGIKQGVARRVFAQEGRRSVNESTLLIRGRMIDVTPTATGITRSSWLVRSARAIGRAIVGKAFNAQPSAIVIDEGAQPHRPPSPNLETWVRRKLNIVDLREVKKAAFRVSRAISQRGLPARRIFTRAFTALSGRLRAIQQKMVDRIIRRLGR